MEQKSNTLTTNQLLTKEDLQEFQKGMLIHLENLLNKQTTQNQWLKSSEVCDMLKITHRTLQTLRCNNMIIHTRIGKTLYYKLADIQQLLAKNQKQESSKS